MRNFVEQVVEFNEIAGTHEEFNTRKFALYVGLILEEVEELLESLCTGNSPPELFDLRDELDAWATSFKSAECDYFVETMTRSHRKKALDACADIAVVSVGGGIAVGADVTGALNEVMESNLSKSVVIDGKRVMLKDANGKVRKPDTYRPPELDKFLK